ncbi:hypothetical protein MKX53_18585 [Psychrobacillus sp. FSL K6-4615]
MRERICKDFWSENKGEDKNKSFRMKKFVNLEDLLDAICIKNNSKDFNVN